MNEINVINSQGLRHPFRPVADAQSKALLLGSFPSIKSRENSFYYGHPQNRFWKVLAILFSANVPETIDDKITFLHRHHIALWDVVSTCEIAGSADRTLIPLAFNDIQSLLHGTGIRQIIANGQKAGKLYQTHVKWQTGIPIHILPSTSPANAAWSLDRLAQAWKLLYDTVFENRVEHEEHYKNHGLSP